MLKYTATRDIKRIGFINPETTCVKLNTVLSLAVQAQLDFPGLFKSEIRIIAFDKDIFGIEFNIPADSQIPADYLTITIY